MRVGYVVLYVNDAEACRRFWVDQIGMVEKRRTEAGTFTIAQVGFADQPFAFELVPLELMKDNPDGLDLATPSIAFAVDDLDATRTGLVGLLEVDEVQASAILNLQLRQLAALERQRIIDEHERLQSEIADYEDILATPARQRSIVGEELRAVAEKYGDDAPAQLDQRREQARSGIPETLARIKEIVEKES